MATSFTNDHALAVRLAEEAGAALLEVRSSGQLSGEELKDAGDEVANGVLLEGLARARPEDAVLSEESPDDGTRVDRERVWIVDPLDGTREFSEPGRDDWAVHVALAVGGVPVVGAVALPALGEVLSTMAPPGPAGALADRPRIAVSRTRPPAFMEPLASRLHGSLVPMGSAGAKAMAVIRGEADAYVHAGGQYEWDSCAPVAVAQSAGFHVSRLDGSTLVYNQENPYLPDLVVCHPDLANRLLDALSDVHELERTT